MGFRMYHTNLNKILLIHIEFCNSSVPHSCPAKFLPSRNGGWFCLFVPGALVHAPKPQGGTSPPAPNPFLPVSASYRGLNLDPE